MKILSSKESKYAGIEYHGQAGSTKQCLNAVIRLIHFGDQINKVMLLTRSNAHCLMLNINYGQDYIAVKSGFSSGYAGEGPRGLALVLQLLDRHSTDIEEYLVDEKIIESIDSSCLLVSELQELESLTPVRPSRWFNYIYDVDQDAHNIDIKLNAMFPYTVPYSLIDERITDLVLMLIESPDSAIFCAYRRLEDVVRVKANLSEFSGTKLFSKAFQDDESILCWSDINAAEQKGRAMMFNGIYMAYRNPRAHKESSNRLSDSIHELLLINELFLLEAESVVRDSIEK